MHRSLVLTVLVLAALVAADPPPFPHQVSELKPDPAVRWGRLENGVRWCLLPNNQPRDKVSIRMAVQSGSLDETDPQRGLAHYLEHMAFNGTTHYPPGELVTRLQRLGLAFGAHTNAHTSFDETVYKLDLPDAQDETLATGLEVMADWAGGMLIQSTEVEKERGVIMAEMRDRDSPDYRQRVAIFHAIYPGLLLADRFPIGEPETVGAASVELIRDFYERWYRPERLVVAVVGAIDPDRAEAAVRGHFADLKPLREASPEPPRGELAAADLRIAIHHEPESDGTSVMISRVRAFPRPHDNVAYRRARLLQEMAETVLGRRLSEIAEKDPQGPLISGSAYTYQWLDLFHAGVEAQARPGQALAAIPVIEHELRRLVEHGPTASELKVVRANLLAQLDAAVAQRDNRSNAQLAGALYTSVKQDEVFLSPEQAKALYAPWVEAATAADITAAAGEAWGSGLRVLDVSGKEDLGADGEAKVRAAWDASVAQPVEAPAAQAAATWGYDERPAAGAIADDHTVAHEIRQLTFANRASATIKRTEFKPGEVLLRLRLQIPTAPRQAGIDELLGRGFMAGGLGRHSLQELREVLAGSTATVNGPAFDEDTVGFAGSCLPKDLERCLQQLRAWLTDPGWRPEAEAQAKAAWYDELKALDTNLDGRTGRRFQELAVHGAPHRRGATLAEAEAVGFADCRAWLDPVLAKAPLTIAVIGDIDVAATADLVAAYIGSLPQRDAPKRIEDGTAPGALDACEPIPTVSEKFEVPGTVARALIQVAWPTDDFFDVVRTRRLGVLAQVLSDRLRIRVREEFGQAYSPYAYHFASQAYDGYGYLGAAAGVEPGHADEARALIIAEARALAEKGIDDDQLAQVKTPVIKNLAARRQQNQYWLESVMILAPWQPQRLEWASTMEADFAAISAADLSALAKRYLADDAALQVVGVCLGAAKDAAKAAEKAAESEKADAGPAVADPAPKKPEQATAPAAGKAAEAAPAK